MIQSSHTTIQIERHPIGIGRLHQWWLTRGPIKMFLVAATFFFVSYTDHPIPAIIIGALLADYVILARGHWLLRVLIGWLIVNMIEFAFGVPI